MHPILFHLTLPWIGVVPIKSFGVMVMLGVIAGSLWLGRALRRVGITDKDASSDLVTWAVITGLLGARLTYILIHPDSVESPLDVIALWKGGIVSYGGFFGGAVGMIWWARKKKLPLARVADCIGPALFLGQAFGRVGCFLVGDDYGKPWDGPWAVRFPDIEGSLIPRELINVPLHPSQLYLCLMNVIIFSSMAWLFARRRWEGQVAVTTMFLYALGRFLIEYTRGDDAARGIFGLFSTAQWWSVATAALALVLYLRVRGKRPVVVTQATPMTPS